MRCVISKLYHFDHDNSDPISQREIDGCVNIIGKWEIGDDLNNEKALKAVLSNGGFTAEQFDVFVAAVEAAAQAKIDRHQPIVDRPYAGRILPDGLVADPRFHKEFSAGVIAQTKQTRERFREAITAVREEMAKCRVIEHTGVVKDENEIFHETIKKVVETNTAMIEAALMGNTKAVSALVGMTIKLLKSDKVEPHVVENALWKQIRYKHKK